VAIKSLFQITGASGVRYSIIAMEEMDIKKLRTFILGCLGLIGLHVEVFFGGGENSCFDGNRLHVQLALL